MLGAAERASWTEGKTRSSGSRLQFSAAVLPDNRVGQVLGCSSRLQFSAAVLGFFYLMSLAFAWSSSGHLTSDNMSVTLFC